MVPRKKMGVDENARSVRRLTLDVPIHLIIPLESQKYALEANIARRIPDVILYSTKIWRSSKSCDFHRRARRKGARRRSFRRLSPIPCQKGGNLPPIPTIPQDFLSRSHGEIEKLVLLVRRGAFHRHHRGTYLAPSAHTRFPLYGDAMIPMNIPWKDS